MRGSCDPAHSRAAFLKKDDQPSYINGVYFATGGSLQSNMNACFYRSGGNWLPDGSLRPEERALSNSVMANLYPNPASHTLNLGFFSETAGNKVLQIFSTTGQEVLRTEQAVAPGHNNLGNQIDALPNGMYWLVSSGGGFCSEGLEKGVVPHPANNL